MFIVLQQDLVSATAQALSVAEKIRALLAVPYQLALLQPSQRHIEIDHSCTSSIGIVLFNDRDTNMNEILKLADNAMYRAKSTGRDSICLHQPDCDT